MIGLLEQILCAILGLGVVIVNLLVGVVNVTIAAIALLIEGIVLALPTIPDPPVIPGGEAADIVGWVLPIGSMLAVVSGLLGVFLAFLGFRVILNWLRAL